MIKEFCKGTTNSGKPCPNFTKPGRDYCCKPHAIRAGAQWKSLKYKKPKKEKPQCIGTTKEGRRCRIKTDHKSGFCDLHRWQSKAERIEIIEEDKFIEIKGFMTSRINPKGSIGKYDTKTYNEYLKTDHWNTVKKRVRAVMCGRCQLCGNVQNNGHVHHNNYSRLGNEIWLDVIYLCSSCHDLYHGG